MVLNIIYRLLGRVEEHFIAITSSSTLLGTNVWIKKIFLKIMNIR